MMDRIPDTPPDGDFARYVEQLSARSAAQALAREATAMVPSGKLPGKPGTGESVKPEPVHLPAGLSVWAMVRWALVAWVALQIVTALFPRAGVLSLPLFLAFAGWALYRFKKTSSGAMGHALRRLAAQAAKEFNQRK